MDAFGPLPEAGFPTAARTSVRDAFAGVRSAAGEPATANVQRAGNRVTRFLNPKLDKPITLEDVKSLSKFLNRATGRGGLGAAEDLGPALSTMFFSPRFAVSRFQTPMSVFSMKGAARREAIKELVAFGGTLLGVLSSIDNLTDADVELDPRSSDFGKIRYKDITIDLAAGELQAIRFTAQMIAGFAHEAGAPVDSHKALGSGTTFTPDRLFDVAETFGRGKLSPQGAFFADTMLFGGRNVVGEKVSASWWEAYRRLSPLAIQDMVEAIQEQGLTGGALAVPAIFGAGVQSFQTLALERNKVAEEMFGDKIRAAAEAPDPELGDISPQDVLSAQDIAALIADGQWYEAALDGDKKVVNNVPSVEQAWDEANERKVVDPVIHNKVVSDLWRADKLDQETGLRESLDAGIQGTHKKDAIVTFKARRYAAAEALFRDILDDDFDDQDNPQRFKDVLAEMWYTAPVF